MTMVLSMSATSTALRRPRNLVMNTSTALWARTYLSAAGAKGLAVVNSTAWPGLSQLRCMPAQASRARSASAWVRGPACRLATRMTIEDMGKTGRTEHGAGASERLAIIVAGPTASGKSALALALAQRLGGTVINADAMQCYRELRIVTARPSPEDESLAPHRLYGVRDAAEPANAAWWRQAALREMEACALPILCGGTGMYFSALVKGIATVPEVPEAARERRGVYCPSRGRRRCTPRSTRKPQRG